MFLPLGANRQIGGLGKTPGGGLSQSAPTAAQGWRGSWQAMDGLSCFEDAGTDACENNDPCQQFNESLGVVASSNLSQAVLASRPTFLTGGAGGKSRLFFDGVGDQMTNAVTINNYMAVGASTIIMALMIPTGYSNGGVILRDASTWFDIQHVTGNLLRLRVYSGAFKQADASFTPDVPLVVSFKHDTGKLYSKVNNGAWVEGDACGNRGGSMALQLNSGAGDVNIYGFSLANVVISDAELAKNINWFKSELGIS